MKPRFERIVIVTDPMCSWCWGMTHEFEKARARLSGEIEFDFMLGGINVHGTQPIGDYGRRYLMRLWREVADTTGQSFGFRLPEEYVHNSLLTCLAVEAMRSQGIDAAFGYMHAIQERFFVDGRNVNDIALLGELAVEYGMTAQALDEQVGDERIRASVRFQVETSGQFGTRALPSLLVEDAGTLRLLAGGYVDADMLESLVVER